MAQDEVGLEALLQRGRTPLYNDLVSLYQETQNALYGLKNASGAQYNLKLKSTGFVKSLKDIAKKHMGINIAQVDIMETRTPNAYATILVPGSIGQMLTNQKKSFSSVLDSIRAVYDDREGRVVDPTYEQVEFGFVFGISVAFWAIRKPDGSFYFSPDEVAAVTIHEIGHFDHWIRTLGRPVFRLLDASDILTYIRKDPDRAVILTLLDKLKKSKHLDPSWKVVLKPTDAYFRNNDTYTDPEYKRNLSAVEMLIGAELARTTVVEFTRMTMAGSSLGTKEVTSALHGIDTERNADEFSVRNGAYSALAAALTKSNKFADESSSALTHLFLWSAPAYSISWFMKFKAVFDVGAEDMVFGYDSITRRLELMAQTAKHAFSDAALSPTVKEDIRQQIKEIESYVAAREKSNYRIIRKRLHEWKTSIGKFGRVIASPIENRMHADYGRLQNANRDLGRHSLYYLAQK